MRISHLIAVFGFTLFARGAAAQAIPNMDIFFLFGVTTAPAQTVSGTAATLAAAHSLGFTYGYGYQVVRKSGASLWVELAPAFGGVNSVHGSVPGKADLSWTFWGAGLRLMVPIQSRLSVYGVAGGGVGGFHSPRVVEDVLSNSSSEHGAFDFGGGVDVRLSRWISLRGEVRDYVTGVGLSGVSGRHHLLPTGGVAFHF